MARAPRRETFDPNTVGIYHLVNRCVRRCFLCGYDDYAKRSYEHRRGWVRHRLIFLASTFAFDCLTFAIMGNHLHLLVRNRPDILSTWSDEEVIRRWWCLFPKKRDQDGNPVELTAEELQKLLQNTARVAELRRRLGDVSWFMRCLAEKIAVRANREDQEPGSQQALGRFWQGRFKLQRILDEAALLACGVYIDLNPIRARLAETPETSWFTSAFERIHSGKEPHPKDFSDQRVPSDTPVYRCSDAWLAPLTCDENQERHAPRTPERASQKGMFEMHSADYLELLDWTGRQIRSDKRGSIPAKLAPILERLRLVSEKWVDLVENFGRWFGTAAGSPAKLAAEASRRKRKSLKGLKFAALAYQA